MRTSQTLIATEKKAPKDADLISHQYMVRAGLIRQTASGIYTWLPTGLKVIQKIQHVVRQVLNQNGASELLMPSILPAGLLKETDRLDRFGNELLTVHDRHDRLFYYGPTHEEPIVDIARRQINSYKQLPLNLYQIQTKFRDEIRPRFGVMRSREFIMKDAYSFHLNFECLQTTYQQMHQAYCDILNRLKLDFKVVQADAGAIGGNITHEFQVLAQAGEDIICYSDRGEYAANIELATYQPPEMAQRPEPSKTCQKVHTPAVKTIHQLTEFLQVPVEQTIKTMAIADDQGTVGLLVVRGDHQINWLKVDKLSQFSGNIQLLDEEQIQHHLGANAGSLGPVNVTCPIIVDYSAAVIADFICGANENDYHLTGINWDRDIPDYYLADIRQVVVGDIAPDGGVIQQANGIEVGHLFQLGTTYSEKMAATVLDQNGKPQPFVMGCYGLGISRLVAATIEQSHDDRGIIWPSQIAPYQVIIIAIQYHKNQQVHQTANEVYQSLLNQGVDVLLDDRDERPGIMFADADLIGAPYQVIIGPKTLENHEVEIKNRRTGNKTLQSVDAVVHGKFE